MVRHLLGKVGIFAWHNEFIGLAQQRIERLLRKLFNVSMLICSIASNIAESLNRIEFFHSEIKGFQVFTRRTG
jgi:hypothetical protein